MTPAEALVALGIPGASVEGQLGGSDVSETWALRHEGVRLVLRIDGEKARRLALDRDREAAVLEAIAGTGLGPELICSRPKIGLLLLKFAPGRSWQTQDMCIPKNLERMAALLRRVHATRIALAGAALSETIEAYAQAIGNPQSTDLAARVLAFLQEHDQGPVVLCHGDPIYANVIDNPGSLMLIDWEYAMAGPAWFDLAVIAEYHRLDETCCNTLLRAYFGAADARHREQLDRWRAAYAAVESLWILATAGAEQLTDTDSRRIAEATWRLGLASDSAP